MENILESINKLITKSREVYSSISSPLYKQEKEKLLDSLKQLEENLEELAREILELSNNTQFQFSADVNPKKVMLFHQNFLSISTKIKKHLFLEANKKEIKHDIINIKDAISRPQIFYDLEEEVKNEINLFIDFLENTKTNLDHKYRNVVSQKKSSDELLKILNHKEEKIKELDKKVQQYQWLEAKENSKKSSVAELEQELLTKTKATEQNSTLLKMHVVRVETELNEMYQHIKKLNNDISHLDNSYLEKEKISLQLIKELKEELLATRYALFKKYQQEEK